MKSHSSLIKAAALIHGLSFSASHAATYYTDGLINWDTITPAWSSTSGGPYNANWVNGNTAVFQGTASNATISGTIQSDGVGFTSDGHTISGGTLNLTSGSTITVNSGSTATINSNITGSNLIKAGDGTLALSGNNPFTGGITINAGRVATTASTGTIGIGGATVNSGGVLESHAQDSFGTAANANIRINKGGIVTNSLNATHRTTIGNLTMTGGTLTSNGGNGETANGHFSIFGTVTGLASDETAVIDASRIALQAANSSNPTTFNIASGSTTSGIDMLVSSVIQNMNSHTNGILKTGAGTLHLTGNNIFTGGVTINEGRVVTSGAGASLGTAGATVNTGGVLEARSGDSLGHAGTSIIHLNGGTLTSGLNANYRNTINTLNFTGGTLASNGGTGDSNGHFSIYGNVNSFASNTTATMSAGTVALQGNNTSTPTTFNIAQGTTSSGIDLSVTSVLKNMGSGNNSINKTGDGVLELAGQNTFTGGVTVNAGTLLANNAISSTGSGAVNVFANATLGGNGTITGATTIQSGARFAPGGINGNQEIGTTTISNKLTLADQAIASFQLTGTTVNIGSSPVASILTDPNATHTGGLHDFALINGEIENLGSLILDLDLSNYTAVEGDVFDLFDFSSGALGDYSINITSGSLGGYVFDGSLFSQYGVLVVATPEPSHLFLLLSTTPLLLKRRRK